MTAANATVVCTDGFYHPRTEPEISALVARARSEGKPFRVCGSKHSVSQAFYAYADAATPNSAVGVRPPPPDGYYVLLDRYTAIRAFDTATGRVTVEAGIVLGYDPAVPGSKIEDGLLWQLQQAGWNLDDLGGITRQTVAGFLSTGSSGGSTRFGIESNIVGLRLIDGRGVPYEVSADDPDPAPFRAALVAMGLFGVISTVTFQCTAAFNIVGQETTTTVAGAAIDLYGLDRAQGVPTPRPSLQDFLQTTDYARVFWWPQVERLVVWEAARAVPEPGFQPKPYREFGKTPLVQELLIAIFYTIIGNLDDTAQIPRKLAPIWQAAERIAKQQSEGEAPLAEDGLQGLAKAIVAILEDLPELAKAASDFVYGVETWTIDQIERLVTSLLPLVSAFHTEIEAALPLLMPRLIDVFVPLDSEPLDDPQRFRDYSYTGLPMDNQADDILMGTDFTEIWLPITRTNDVMQLLQTYFTSASTKTEALARTGLYTFELYAAKANDAWLSPAFSDGDDVWKDGVFRVDVFWYWTFAGSPLAFYTQFWSLLRQHGIPFRLHWGKFQPADDVAGAAGWTAWFRGQYAQWDAFLASRSERDPEGVFFSPYWRARLLG